MIFISLILRNEENIQLLTKRGKEISGTLLMQDFIGHFSIQIFSVLKVILE